MAADVPGREAQPQGPPLRAVLGTILFVLLVPGTVVVGLPWLLSGWAVRPPLLGLPATRWLGALLVVASLPLFVDFLWRFVSEGHGTPAPVAPPRHLVVHGGYRWTRNPGYVAVVSLILGQGLWLGSAAVVVYAAVVAVAFHGFVVLYEEPTLRRTFGAQYEAYCRSVPRWFPRLGRRGASSTEPSR